MKRKALGKGLRSLIPEAPPRARSTSSQAANSTGGLREIDLDRIHPNPNQPRERFDDESLAELTASLERNGVIQPIVVRPAGEDRFELVAGERRWRAAQMAGLMRVPAMVRDVPDDRLLEFALIENVQRQALDPIEEAGAYQTLIDDLGLTQEEVSERVGKRRTTITNALRLLNLPATIQESIRTGRMSRGHAKVLAGLGSTKLQEKLAARILERDLSVRETEELLRRESSPGRRPMESSKSRERDPNVLAAEQSLQRAVGTKVRIVEAKRGGRLELYFYGPDELDRLYQLVMDGSTESSS